MHFLNYLKVPIGRTSISASSDDVMLVVRSNCIIQCLPQLHDQSVVVLRKVFSHNELRNWEAVTFETDDIVDCERVLKTIGILRLILTFITISRFVIWTTLLTR